MKKIFTLIAMTLMTVGAMAQGVYKVTEGIEDGTVIKSVNGLSAKFSDSWTKKDKAAVTYNDIEYDVCIGGETNPDPKPSNGVPTKGCFISFNPAANGTISVIVNINASKKIFVFENEEAISFTSANGESKSGDTFSEAYAGNITFNVSANKTYIIVVEGSKLMCYGFEYTTSGTVEETEPTISITESISAFIGSTASITSTITGYPTPNVKWYSNTTASNEGGTELDNQVSTSLDVTSDKPGTFYYYAVVENTKGKATSNVCTVEIKDPRIVVSESEDKIIFETVYSAGSLNGCTFIGGALELSILDNNNKLSVEDVATPEKENSVYFGTLENDEIKSYVKTSGRMKTGNASGDKLGLKLVVGKAGKLNIYARTGSGNSKRKIVISQNGNEVFSQELIDSDMKEVEYKETIRKVYPAYSVDVNEGTYDIKFPDGNISIYALTIGDVFEPIVTSINAVSTVKAENSAIYNALGQRVNANAKGIMIQNGKKYIAK